MAKKLAEEAIEVVIDTMNGERDAVVRESADLLYNLVVLWVASEVRPEDVWHEMARRERLFGLAEKVPKKLLDGSAAARSCCSKAAVPQAPRLIGAARGQGRRSPLDHGVRRARSCCQPFSMIDSEGRFPLRDRPKQARHAPPPL